MTTTVERPVAPAPAPKRPRTSPGAGALNLLNGGFLLLWGLLTTLPLLWAVVSSFKTNTEFLSDPWGLPMVARFDNFARAWTVANIGQYFVNSIIVVVISVPLTMLFGAMVAYVLSRYSFPGNRFIYFVFVGGLIFPVFLALVRIMLSKEGAKGFTEKVSSLTVVQGASDGVELPAGLTSARAALTTAGDNVVSWMYNTWYGKMWNPGINTQLGDLLTARKTVDEFCAGMEAEAKAVRDDDSITKYTR